MSVLNPCETLSRTKLHHDERGKTSQTGNRVFGLASGLAGLQLRTLQASYTECGHPP